MYECDEDEQCLDYLDERVHYNHSYIETNSRINFGITSFNNMGTALISVMQVVTLESWGQIMFNLMDADEPNIVVFYFIFLILICSFFILNIILAVIIDAFIKIQQTSISL